MYGGKYLAVLNLEPVGLSDTEAKVLTQRLTSKMIELSDYTVVERANIDKILKEQKFQHSGCTDSECAVEIGQLLNADITTIGTVSKFGNTYTIDARIINVESGEAIQSATFTHSGEIDELIKEGIVVIAHKLCDKNYSNISSAKSNFSLSRVEYKDEYKFLTVKTENRVSNIFYSELNSLDKLHIGYALKDIPVGIKLETNKKYTIEAITKGISDTINVIGGPGQTIIFKKVS